MRSSADVDPPFPAAVAARRAVAVRGCLRAAIAAIVGTVTAAGAGTPFSDIGEPGEMEIRMLAVAPEARRQGVARQLVAACEVAAVAAGADAVVLSTVPAMAAAQRLYETLGYRRTPERDWAIHGLHLLTYRKEL